MHYLEVLPAVMCCIDKLNNTDISGVDSCILVTELIGQGKNKNWLKGVLNINVFMGIQVTALRKQELNSVRNCAREILVF
jgi:hypothetical protein